MKTIHIFLMISFIISSVAFSQTVYPVSPGTTNNRVSLTVVNESLFADAENIEVRLTKHSDALNFATPVQTLKSLSPGQTAPVTFAFDVQRNAPVNESDTLRFLVTDQAGGSWSKSVILQFAPPGTYALEQNYPNPFNPMTTIKYQLPEEARVRLEVYDLLGRKVVTLLEKRIPAGYHEILWDASFLASGVYIYRLSAGNFTQTRKMILMK